MISILMMRRGLLIGSIGLLALCSCAKVPKLVVAGSGWNKIAIVDKKSKQVEWTHQLDDNTECNSVIVVPGSKIAYSYRDGVRMINADQQVVWDYKLQKKGEVHSVTQLPNGGFLLAASGSPALLIELDANGREVKKVKFDGGCENMHGQLRQAAKSKNGNYIIPLLSRRLILELDPAGVVVAEYPLPQSPFSVMELPSGNLIASCGDGHFFVEIERKSGQIIRQVDESAFSEKEIMHYVAQMIPLKNGNLLLCNWNGHFKKGETKQIPHLIEFDKKYNIVWRLDDFENIQKVSAGFYVEDGKHLKFKK